MIPPPVHCRRQFHKDKLFGYLELRDFFQKTLLALRAREQVVG